MLQSQAVVIEGAALLRRMAMAGGFTTDRAAERYTRQDVSLGVAGLSWGGAMASCVALGSRLHSGVHGRTGFGLATCHGLLFLSFFFFFKQLRLLQFYAAFTFTCPLCLVVYLVSGAGFT